MAFQAILVREPALAHLILLLFFLGFATKAGILPMGSWLPDAYPAAPTAATAAFAGAMSKLGIYGLVRVFLTLLPLSGAMEAWGWIIAAAGAGSLFVGTLTALKQDDAKRLMAFHVVGQVGYMFLGVGVGLVLLPGSPLLGSLAVTAGLFHLLNNALYKTSLFLGAGAVHSRAGTRSLNGLGGLGRSMPWTAGAALAASLAIAGVPPLNGFASKWLLYGTGILGGEGRPLLVVLVLVAMFISLVTLASFLKYYGSAFLGPPREEGGKVQDVGLRHAPPTGDPGAGVRALRPLPLDSPLGDPERSGRRCSPRGAPGHWAGSWLPGWGLDPALGLTLGEAGLALWAPLPVTLLFLVLALGVYLRDPACRRSTDPGRPGLDLRGGGGARRPAVPRRELLPPLQARLPGLYPSFKAPAPAFPAGLRRALNPDGWLYLPLARWVERSSRTVARSHVGVPQVYLLWIVLGAVAGGGGGPPGHGMRRRR